MRMKHHKMLFPELPERWGCERYGCFLLSTVLSDGQLTRTTIKITNIQNRSGHLLLLLHASIHPSLDCWTSTSLWRTDPSSSSSLDALGYVPSQRNVSAMWLWSTRNTGCTEIVLGHWTEQTGGRISGLELLPFQREGESLWGWITQGGRTELREGRKQSPGNTFRALIKLRQKGVISSDSSVTQAIPSFWFIQSALGLLATNGVMVAWGNVLSPLCMGERGRGGMSTGWGKALQGLWLWLPRGLGFLGNMRDCALVSLDTIFGGQRLQSYSLYQWIQCSLS